MKSGNQDKGEGKAKDLKGRVREAVGDLTNDREMKAKGKADQAEGHAQQARGDVKKAFKL